MERLTKFDNVFGAALGKPGGAPWSHQWHDALSLAAHRLIAERIRRDPALLDVAREDLVRWLGRSTPGEAPSNAHSEWREILASNDLSQIVEIMTDPTEEGHRRRQSSPFVGILSQEEMRALRQRYEDIPLL